MARSRRCILAPTLHLLDGLRPDRHGDGAAGTRGAHLVYATPAQLRLMLDTPAPAPAPELRLIVCGGAKLDPATRTALAARFPQAEVREFYGTSEASFITLADGLTPPHSRRQRLSRRGDRPARPFGHPAGLGPLALSVRRLRRRLRPCALAGRLAVDRRDRPDWDGTHLVLSGRADRMVTVADQNVFPEEIEAFLLSQPGVTRAAVLPRPDRRARPCDRGGRSGRRRGDDPRRLPAGPRPAGGAEAGCTGSPTGRFCPPARPTSRRLPGGSDDRLPHRGLPDRRHAAGRRLRGALAA